MLKLLILLSSDASLYRDTFDMMHRYPWSQYRPISIIINRNKYYLRGSSHRDLLLTLQSGNQGVNKVQISISSMHYSVTIMDVCDRDTYHSISVTHHCIMSRYLSVLQ